MRNAARRLCGIDTEADRAARMNLDDEPRLRIVFYERSYNKLLVNVEQLCQAASVRYQGATPTDINPIHVRLLSAVFIRAKPIAPRNNQPGGAVRCCNDWPDVGVPWQPLCSPRLSTSAAMLLQCNLPTSSSLCMTCPNQIKTVSPSLCMPRCQTLSGAMKFVKIRPAEVAVMPVAAGTVHRSTTRALREQGRF